MAEPAIMVTKPVEFVDQGDIVIQTVVSGPVVVEVHMRWPDFETTQARGAELLRERSRREFVDAQGDHVAEPGRGYGGGPLLVLDPPESWIDGGIAYVRYRHGDELHTFAMPAHAFITSHVRDRERIAKWRQSQRKPARLPKR